MILIKIRKECNKPSRIEAMKGIKETLLTWKSTTEKEQVWDVGLRTTERY